jgi:hypothetical protein
MKQRPRTHCFVTVKEMPEQQWNRRLAREKREELWREYIDTKRDEFESRFGISFVNAVQLHETRPYFKPK